jgi:phosphoesterase RecJ-like protein
MKIISQILQSFDKCKTFFIAGHIKPDGDTVGTGLALASMLGRMGKKAYVYSLEPVPEYLQFLKGAKGIKIAPKARGEFDCAVILECIDLDRMGNIITPEQAGVLINIDHHSSFSNYGHINYIDSAASSSAELLFNIFKQSGMPILKHEADDLYTALVTDTGKFQQANSTPKAFRMAADLLEAGVIPTEIYGRLYATQSLPSLNLMGEALSGLKTACSGKIAHFSVTRRMYKATKSGASDTEGIINYSMMIPGTVVGIFFRETETPGLIKISMRSRDHFDVNRIAKHFGGGGHKNASGCSIKGSLESVEKSFLTYVSKLL